MNDGKIIVNGSVMDKSYFEDNLKEAESYKWTKQSIETISDHQHCIICLTSLPDKTSTVVYHAEEIWLCNYCHDHFLENKS